MAALKELRERYAAKAKRAKEIVDQAEKEDRGLTTEERGEYDSTVSEALALRDRVQRQEDDLKQLDPEQFSTSRERESEQEWREGRRSYSPESHSGGPSNLDRRRALKVWLSRGRNCNQHERESFRRVGDVDLNNAVVDLSIHRGFDEMGNEFSAPKTIEEARDQARTRRKMAESRATQVVGTDNVGGFTVPDEMLGPIEINLLAYGAVRQVATVFSTATGEKYSVPTVNDTSNEGRLLAEDTAATETTTTFGQTSLNSYKMSSDMIPVSLELMQDSRSNMPVLIGNLLSERIARGANRYFTTGTGSSQPQGVVAGAANSSVTTAAAATITLANVQSLLHSIDPAYRINSQFMFNDTTALLLRNLADTTGRPLWQLGMAYGLPDTIAGYPYVINQHMASGANSKAMLFGDFSKFYIREVLSLQLTRLDERYAEYHRTAFIAVARYDSKLINAGTAPIKYLTMGA